MKQIIAVLTCALLVGCVTSFGNKFDVTKVELLKPGETTEKEIVGWFGQPMSTTIMASGNRKHGWLYGTAGIGSVQQNILETVVSTNGLLVDFNAKLDRPTTNAPAVRAASPKGSR
jgi:hypothetical protein